MKRLLLLFTIFLFTATANLLAQGNNAPDNNSPYFYNKANTTLEYTRTTAEGDVKWYHTMQIGNIIKSGDTTTVNYTSFIVNHKHKPYYGDEPAELSAAITKNATTLDVAESVAALFRTIFPKKTKITSTGGESTLPSYMAPGDTLPDVYASVRALGLTMKITVSHRQVLKKETIKTPAGEFECIVVRERKVEKGMGRNRHTIADTWYSKGTGMVRHDTYNTNFELQTSEILTEIR